uniref:Uncharacterized protein n=1 Tax=Panagrolaimus davidi TaxID=227884 RepID=A0A914QA81_9BILA
MTNLSENPEKSLDLSYQKVENELLKDLSVFPPNAHFSSGEKWLYGGYVNQGVFQPYDHVYIDQRIGIFTEKYLIKPEIWSKYIR